MGINYIGGSGLNSAFVEKLLIHHNEFSDSPGWAINIGHINQVGSPGFVRNNEVKFNLFRELNWLSTDASAIHLKNESDVDNHTHIFENWFDQLEYVGIIPDRIPQYSGITNLVILGLADTNLGTGYSDPVYSSTTKILTII